MLKTDHFADAVEQFALAWPLSRKTLVAMRHIVVTAFVLAGVLLSAASPSRADTACDSIQKQLDGQKELKKETSDDLKQPRLTAAERARLQQQLKQVSQQIASTELALKKCLLDAASPRFLPPPARVAPQRILEINYSNPSPNFDPSDPLWAGKLVNVPSFDPKHPKTYPKDVEKEWKQVLAPEEDYDKFTLVGASGWVLGPHYSSADVPFSHPFGFDWEFAMALDKPKNGPGPFDFLLAAGNKAPGGPSDHSEEKIAEDIATTFLGLSVPKGLLAVEMDGGNVPNIFANNVKQGHRIATFGRWIVDAGHGNFATEIHPPLLMAAAGTNGKDSTRVLFTSRPYLAGQIYTTDQSTAYNDAAADDGTFFQHLVKEIRKVIGVPFVGIPESVLVEAHPKIKDHPFRGAHLLHLVIRPPSPADPRIAQQLSVSFHFTVRNGCAVQVTSSAPDTIDVFIALSDGGYHPPPLPARSEKTYSRQELDALSKGAGTQILELDAIAGALGLATAGAVNTAKVELILGRGIKTDTYAPVSGASDILSADNAVRDVLANSIPAGKGVTTNENQPFPVVGWLEVKWVRQGVVR